MRIIGGHDYYDGVMAYGQDDTVFVRKKFDEAESIPAAEVPLCTPKQASWLIDHIRRRTDGKLDAKIAVIWFAGKRFSNVCLRERYSGESFKTMWSEQEFLESLEAKTTMTRRQLAVMGPRLFRGTVNQVFHTAATEEERSWLIGSGISISIGELRSGEKRFQWKFDTDGLKDFQFARMIDPFTAYQELSMWVGGVLAGPERPTVDISDKDKIAKRGFDEWSFRKMPTA